MSEFWMIRAGRTGERTDWALANDVVGGGWTDYPDLTKYRDDKAALRELVTTITGGSNSKIGNYTGQLWSMIHRIESGAFMVLSIKATSQIAIGQVTSGYRYVGTEPDPSKRHQLGVKWLRTDISKTLIKHDLIQQMNSALTVFLISNDDAATRLEKLLQGDSDPGSQSVLEAAKNQMSSAAEEAEQEMESEPLNLEDLARDDIARKLIENFKGHDLSELVTAILEAEGFTCRNSPPGADGGVDVLAGRGVLGMDPPTLVVQVKSQSGAVGDPVLQQLSGAITKYGADQALLVALAGITGPAKSSIENQYFKVRVWTISDVLNKVFEHYSALPNEIRTRLPLKQIWVPASLNEAS